MFDPGHGRDTPGFPRRFSRREQIRFHHCDPAGIAFFARLDELLNATFEDWCAAVDLPFHELMSQQRSGFPLVHACIDYTDVLRMGDEVTIGHHVREARRSSITFDVRIDSGDRACLSGTHIRVMTSLETNRAVPLPDRLHALLQETRST